MNNSMSDSVRKSTTTDSQGVQDPERIHPIADAEHGGNARVVGFMYRGNGYGQNSAWITCDSNDLERIRR